MEIKNLKISISKQISRPRTLNHPILNQSTIKLSIIQIQIFKYLQVSFKIILSKKLLPVGKIKIRIKIQRQ
jgi:hypothetical protein